MVTSNNVIASIVAVNAVSTGKVAGNIADHSCLGCLPMFQGLLCRVAGVAGNIGIRYARDLSIVKNIQLAWEMLAWTLGKLRKRGEK